MSILFKRRLCYDVATLKETYFIDKIKTELRKSKQKGVNKNEEEF